MESEIISSIIIASATVFSAILVVIVANHITKNANKIKAKNEKLVEDWEFWYELEFEYIKQISELKNVAAQTLKIENREAIQFKLGRKLNINGKSKLKN